MSMEFNPTVMSTNQLLAEMDKNQERLKTTTIGMFEIECKINPREFCQEVYRALEAYLLTVRSARTREEDYTRKFDEIRAYLLKYRDEMSGLALKMCDKNELLENEILRAAEADGSYQRHALAARREIGFMCKQLRGIGGVLREAAKSIRKEMSDG